MHDIYNNAEKQFWDIMENYACLQTGKNVILVKGLYCTHTRHVKFEACPESKDTSHVGRLGNFLCLV
jgi:hypothetical protein